MVNCLYDEQVQTVYQPDADEGSAAEAPDDSPPSYTLQTMTPKLIHTGLLPQVRSIMSLLRGSNISVGVYKGVLLGLRVHTRVHLGTRFCKRWCETFSQPSPVATGHPQR